MLAIVKHGILRTLEEKWRTLPRAEARPWGVWVRWYAPIPDDGCDFPFTSRVPLKAWFLTERGYSERGVWEFQRFLVVQWVRPWCPPGWSDPVLHRKRTMYHEIAMAAFAAYQDSTDIYLEWIWGGLFGEGWRVKADETGALTDWTLTWIS